MRDVFEPALCDQLIGLYETNGGEISGFMRDENGATVGVHNNSFKSRRDYTITDETIIKTIQARIVRRIVPEIMKVHHFHVTRMERYIVACYDEGEGGHFRAHRDNTTRGTAHRRFAVSINLNEDFDGAGIAFPEYGMQEYKPPAGGAIIFSCTLLHQVSKITRGRRFAFLPFLYDDAAAAIREKNRQYLANQEKAPEDNATA